MFVRSCPHSVRRPLLFVSTGLALIVTGLTETHALAQTGVTPSAALEVQPIGHAAAPEEPTSAVRSADDLEGAGTASQEPMTSSSKSEQRYREGRVIRDRLASFKITGDRVELVPSDGHEPLTVLENLALERVKNEIVRIGAVIRWDVTAMVTEYEGSNFVLLQRATIASQVGAER